MTRTRWIAVAVALVMTLVAGGIAWYVHLHRKPAEGYEFKVEQATLGSPDTLGLAVAGTETKGIVVYFHGADQTARVIQDDLKHRNLFTPLLREGYAVVAADAGGNAFGNPASQEAYRRLIAAARQKYPAGPLFFVAESMGALPALALIRQDSEHQIKAMVGISPLMGLPPEARTVSYIEGPWGGPVPPDADPMSWPPAVFADRVFRLYLPDNDTVIPAGARGGDFAARFGKVATVEVIKCAGGHVASPCYQGEAVLEWLSGLH